MAPTIAASLNISEKQKFPADDLIGNIA